MILEFFVPGMPATAGSKRAFVYTPKGGGKPRAVVTDTNRQGKTWRSDVQAAAIAAKLAAGSVGLLEDALRVTLIFVLPRPASISVRRRPYPTVKPDVDKLSRAMLDALTQVVWKDDAQVVRKTVAKLYQDQRLSELVSVGVHVRIEREPPWAPAGHESTQGCQPFAQGASLEATAQLPLVAGPTGGLLV